MSTKVQSVLFSKLEGWTKEKAEAWLKKHGYTGLEVDEKEDTLRYRQAEPEEFIEETFRTIPVGRTKEELGKSESSPVIEKEEKWERDVTFCKADSKKQIVWGVVYAPGEVDTQGDYMTAEDIEKACYGFMKKMALDNIDKQHDRQKTGAYVVENFIVRKGDADFPDCEGAWVMATHIPDSELWKQVENGDLTGYSLSGSAGRATQKTADEFAWEAKMA